MKTRLERPAYWCFLSSFRPPFVVSYRQSKAVRGNARSHIGIVALLPSGSEWPSFRIACGGKLLNPWGSFEESDKLWDFARTAAGTCIKAGLSPRQARP